MQPQQKWLRKTNMATGKLKVNFKMPTPSAADRMYAKHQIIRKAAGLPDVDNNPDRPNAGKYSSGDSKPVKRVNPIATPSVNEEDITVVKKGSSIKKKISDASYNVFKSHGFVKEEEQLDELSPATKASYVAKAKDQIKQSMPFTKKSDEYRDIAKNFIEKRKKGIAKANESVTVGRLVGRGNVHEYDRNPPPKDGSELENIPFNAKTEQQKRMKKALTDLGNKLKQTDPRLKESKDSQEYDYEGDMAKSDLRSIIHNAKTLHDMLDDNTNLAEWCQSKITLAEDYISTVTNYMRSEMNEEVKKNEYHISGKHKFPTKDEHAVTVKHTESGREHVHSGKGKYLSKLIKTRYNINHYFEEVELDEMVVVKTNKPIGTRVADIGPGGKEYNVKTDKAWDDSKKKQPQGADFAAQRRKERLAKSGRMDEKENLPGLWANIHAKRKRGEAPAKPGDEDYPKTLNIEDANPCWTGYKRKPGTKKYEPGSCVKEGIQDDPKADQMTTDDTKFPKKSRKAAIVKSAAKKMPAEDQFQAKPVLDSQVTQQTNK
jgi:hypothetical protein